MVEAALSALGGLRPAECLMAGDRLETDILMGRRAGIATALVLPGIATRQMAEAAPPDERPDYVLESMAAFVS